MNHTISDGTAREDDPVEAVQHQAHLTPGLTFYELYLRGELPWPRESLDDNDEIATEYVSLIVEFEHAMASGNRDTVRRLRGEIEARRFDIDQMDAYASANALPVLCDALDARVAGLDAAKELGWKPPMSVMSEEGRFTGPAPLYRRGRAYVQALVSALNSAGGECDAGSKHWEARAAQLLEVVSEIDNPDALQDFIAGIAREAERQLRRVRANGQHSDPYQT